MKTLSLFIFIAHLLGLTIGLGAASVKLILLYSSRKDAAFVQAFLKIVRPITRMILVGLVVLTLSGIGWMLMGFFPSTLLIVKLVLVGIVWMIGPVIDKVVEPRFIRNAPLSGASPSIEFLQARKQYLLVESLATGLMYVVALIGVLI